ncbi:hypothetical protein PGIGA_G00146920 [Pangasianodon gigas]|uniref:Uncharacterized protein n=1 Tax=Pangasianodon gigas TaxID=30993 RepID=A0ACC5XP31_PANGG|nr:hypothetical protein [Pangasianodon gigas]
MVKGKKKTRTIGLRLEEPHKNKVEKETKENKQDLKTTRQEQLTIYSDILRSQLRNSPLFPIQEESSSCSTHNASRHQVRLAINLHSPKEENKGTQLMSFGPKEKQPHEDKCSATVLPNKSELGTRAKAKVPHKKAEGKTSQQTRKVTDYYPIRRSARKSKAELKSEEQSHIDDLILNNVEDGLKVKYIEGKGRGVFADREFNKGQFIVEYHGDLLPIADAKRKEAQYAQDPAKGCYMYYFRYKNHTYCVDATKETNRLGRLINHSKNGNCQTRLHNINGVPHLILVASRDIKAEEELLYDYGDRSKEAIAAHPWLKY